MSQARINMLLATYSYNNNSNNDIIYKYVQFLKRKIRMRINCWKIQKKKRSERKRWKLHRY